jgi:hypothetical protein
MIFPACLTVRPNTGDLAMADVIDLRVYREALAAAAATDLLRALLSEAAEACATGELSKEDRSDLVLALNEAFGLFGDGGGYRFSFSTRRVDTFQSNEVLHKVLCMTAKEAATRILSAEGRAILLNAVFLALGGRWRVDRAA